jgi:hypothetical protein
MQCTAKSKRSQQQCRRHATPGRRVCHIHGGKSPIGPAHYKHRTGRYSKFLPSRMAAVYDDVRNDPKLLELRDDIATVDARIIDLLQRVETGEAGSLWREALGVMATFRAEQRIQSVEGMTRAFIELERVIQQGADDYAVWDEILQLMEQRRKLCLAEQRRATRACEQMSAEQAMMLMRVLVGIVKKHVPDQAALGGIASDIQALIHRNGHEASLN